MGIARAAYYSLRSGGIVAGGSTITQQVARNLLLPEDRYERTLRRKLREAVLALRIEASYDKDEILALYLNSTFYGRLSFGAEAASQAFFGKPLASLDLAECAFLAGLPQAPDLYDPERGEAWRDRQRVVLDLMVRQGFISQEEADMAAREPCASSLHSPAFALPTSWGTCVSSSTASWARMPWLPGACGSIPPWTWPLRNRPSRSSPTT